MKVSIKVNKIRFTILLPIFLCELIIRYIRREELTEELKYCIIQTIRYIKSNLKEYKGMKIVEVKTADGQEVVIKA